MIFDTFWACVFGRVWGWNLYDFGSNFATVFDAQMMKNVIDFGLDFEVGNGRPKMNPHAIRTVSGRWGRQDGGGLLRLWSL